MSRKISFSSEFPILLAPMAGITDVAFREVCLTYGASLTYTEMISAKGLLYGDRNTKKLLAMSDAESKCGIQLFGSEPDVMANMASWLCNEYGDRIALIDINMGCPAPKITSNNEGSSLMRHPELAASIVKAVSKASSVPVTVKQRIGWNRESINGVEFAKLMEENGADMITVHGRTREQMYSGNADIDIIGEIKSHATIPIIGNGDIFNGEAAKRMRNKTGCDGIMIARGALGNPFIFEEVRCCLNGASYTPPSNAKRIEVALTHAKRHIELKGARAFVELRKHMAWYTHGMRGASAMRVKLNTASTYEELEELLLSLL